MKMCMKMKLKAGGTVEVCNWTSILSSTLQRAGAWFPYSKAKTEGLWTGGSEDTILQGRGLSKICIHTKLAPRKQTVRLIPHRQELIKYLLWKSDPIKKNDLEILMGVPIYRAALPLYRETHSHQGFQANHRKFTEFLSDSFLIIKQVRILRWPKKTFNLKDEVQNKPKESNK